MKEIKAKEISAKSFKKYGRYISEITGEPLAENDKIQYWDEISKLTIEGEISTGIVKGFSENKIVEGIERHLETPELMVALEGEALILFGKPGGSENKVEDLQAFRIEEGEAFFMNPGTWHSVPFPAQSECKLLVVFKAGTPENDMHEIELSEKVKILN